MLSFNFDRVSGLLEVKQELHSFTKTDVQYWYYDTKKWLKSAHGKKNDQPTRVMSEQDIAWVKTYYLPKVLETCLLAA